MDVEKKTISEVNDLIQLALDGERFYRAAARGMSDAALADLFARIADTKSTITQTLAEVVEKVDGQPSESGTLLGVARELYARGQVALGAGDFGYLSELEASEDRLLNEFKATATDRDISVAAREAIVGLIPLIEDTRAVMARRKAHFKPVS